MGRDGGWKGWNERLSKGWLITVVMPLYEYVLWTGKGGQGRLR